MAENNALGSPDYWKSFPSLNEVATALPLPHRTRRTAKKTSDIAKTPERSNTTQKTLPTA